MAAPAPTVTVNLNFQTLDAAAVRRELMKPETMQAIADAIARAVGPKKPEPSACDPMEAWVTIGFAYFRDQARPVVGRRGQARLTTPFDPMPSLEQARQVEVVFDTPGQWDLSLPFRARVPYHGRPG